jgi:hypothetical protein
VFADAFLAVGRALAYIAHMKIVERRSAARVAVSVEIAQYVEGQTHRCLASNLSLSGVYIERPISSFVRHSTAVELRLSLPDGEGAPVCAQAEIVYDCFDLALHGSALRFTAMSARDRARLSAFVERGRGGPDSSSAHAA